MGRLTKCLICYSTSQSENKIASLERDPDCFGNSGLLADEVLIIFVVRRLLNVPTSVCDRFLRDLGSPTKWCLTFCGTCQDLINDAKEVAKVIYNLEEKLHELKSKIQIQIQESYKDFDEPPRRNFHKHLKALSEIRYCVAKGFEDLDWNANSSTEEEEEFQDHLDYGNNENDEYDNFDEEDVLLESTERDDISHYDCDPIPKLEEDKSNNCMIPLPEQVKQRERKKKPEVFKKFKCPKCIMRFTSEDLRYSHVQRKHKGIPFPYQCTICPKRFTYKSDLEVHMKRISHQYPERVTAKPENICKVVGCGRKFKLPCMLRDHIRRIHDDRKDLICEICSSSYKSKKSLKAHQVTLHTGIVDILSHLCTFCGKSFPTLGLFELHVNTKHKNVFRFYCSHCQKGFTSEKTKIEHERIHTGEKPFICEHCGRAFALPQRLKEHSRIHTGEKPYHCTTCGQDFADRTWFKRHQELHSGIINNCHICGKGFPIKHNLKIHMKSHANPNGTNNRKLKANSDLVNNVERKKIGRRKRKADIEVEASVGV